MPPHPSTFARPLGPTRTLYAVSGAKIALLESIVAHLREENERLRSLADHDPVTGLGNRRRFEEALQEVVGAAQRYHGRMSVLLLDLDGMKQVNDTAGHAAGDEALRAVAEVIASSVRGCDVAVRLGGDEFAVILPATDTAGARIVAERIRARVAELRLSSGLRVTASVGVAELGPERAVARAAAEVVGRADEALYAAKNRGRDRVEADPLHLAA